MSLEFPTSPSPSPSPNALDVEQRFSIKNKHRNMDKNRFTQIALTFIFSFATTQRPSPIALLKNLVHSARVQHEKHSVSFVKAISYLIEWPTDTL